MKCMHVIKASAGSGKTYTLARTYIVNMLGVKQQDNKYHLRRSPQYHRHILAITFTNKATDEMKERIVKQLHLLSLGKGAYVEFFEKNFVDSIEDIKRASAKALNEILFNYNSFAVSTIDSFFQTLLRTFAREIDYDNSYEIELDDDMALQTAVHDFLLDISGERHQQKSKVYKWVQEFIKERLKINQNWNFFGNTRDLVKFAKNINKEFYRDRSDEIQTYFGDMGEPGLSRIERFRKSIIACRDRYQQSLDDGTFNHRFRNLADANGWKEESFHKGRLLQQMYLGTRKFENDIDPKYATSPDGLNSLFKKQVFNDTPVEVLEEINGILAEAIKARKTAKLMDDLLNNVWQLGLLSVIDKKLRDNMRESNTLLLSDTGSLIQKIVDAGNDERRIHDNTSFIYERVGTRYHNFMIDEFQDTSHKQYDNFKPLLSESIAGGNDVLIIGDEKQSIYRFRNSDPSMLREELEHDFKESYDDSTLDDNYRSCKNIIEFNNVLFGYSPRAYFGNFPVLMKTYRNVHQNVKKDKFMGYVQVNFPIADNKNDQLKAVLPQLPERIYSVLERGFSQSDIMILVNKNDEGRAVVNYLLNYNINERPADKPQINIVSDESLMISNAPAVRMVIDVLRFLESTLFDPALAKVDKDKEKTLSKRVERLLVEQRRYKLLHDYGKALLGNSGATPSETLQQVLERERGNSHNSDVTAAIEHLATKALETLPDPTTQPLHLLTVVDSIIKTYMQQEADSCDENNSPFVTAFQDVVLTFTAGNNGGTIREFLRYWDERCRALSIPASAQDSIQVMTIHKSKGLEAPVVMMPFANWELNKFKDKEVLWMPRELWLNPDGGNGPLEGIGGSESDRNIVPPLIPVKQSILAKMPEFASFYNAELEKTLIDNLNKTYVAFTRPRQELYIWSPTKTQNETSTVDNVNALLRSFCYDLEKGNGTLSIKIDKKRHEFTLDIKALHGTITVKDKNDKEKGIECLTGFEIGDRYETRMPDNNDEDKYAIDAQEINMPRYSVRPMADSVKVTMPEADSLFKREGKDMHWLMSLVTDKRDVSHAIAMATMGNRFNTRDERYWTVDRAAKLLSMVVDDPLTACWFDPRNTVFNERTITDAKKNIRPDRVVVTPEGKTIVIEYKFGSNYRRATIAEYTKKVQEYMTKLRDAGFTDIVGYLYIPRDTSHPIRTIKI